MYISDRERSCSGYGCNIRLWVALYLDLQWFFRLDPFPTVFRTLVAFIEPLHHFVSQCDRADASCFERFVYCLFYGEIVAFVAVLHGAQASTRLRSSAFNLALIAALVGECAVQRLLQDTAMPSLRERCWQSLRLLRFVEGRKIACFAFLRIPASRRCAQRLSFRQKPGSSGEWQRGSATDSRSKLTRQQLCTEPLRVSFAEGIECLDSRWFEVLNVASYDRQSML